MQNKNWIIPAAVIVAVIAAVFMTAPAFSITSGGSTFAAPQWQHWARLFYEKTGITVNYQAVGSGAGQTQFVEKTFAFAGTDIPLSKERYDNLVEQYGRGAFMQCPVMLGSLVIAYNVPEIAYSKTRVPLRLTSDLVA
ncbi:MAG: substrate-binding domain-containing protein, partial [Thermoproteus sp.]|nr:substrate-binding domain-containing protein [Thermoproteus sp.]